MCESLTSFILDYPALPIEEEHNDDACNHRDSDRRYAGRFIKRVTFYLDLKY